MKNDLTHSQNSLERHETSLTVRNKQKDTLIENLREELKTAAAEKERLQQRLQAVVDSDEINKAKVSS